MAAPVSWSFTTAAATSPYTIWNNTVTPAVALTDDPNAVELGVKFRSDVVGFITGLRFYKGASNTGTHVGNLWTDSGQLLATATFSGETASGWQQVSFLAPVAISAGTTYIASYYAPNGGYAYSSGYFASSGADSGPLHALANGADGVNGLYLYGPDAFPTQSYNASNYWIDITFSTAADTPPTITSQTPASNASGVATTTKVTAVFSESVQSASISFVLRTPATTWFPPR